MGRLSPLVRRSYSTLVEEGVDVWLARIASEDFVWDLTPMGLGRYETVESFREFFADWTSSYADWFIEPSDIEELSDEVVVNHAHQGGRLRGSDEAVEWIYGQLGVWRGDRVAMAVSYWTLEEARAAAEQLIS